jgi:hypothetical protein
VTPQEHYDHAELLVEQASAIPGGSAQNTDGLLRLADFHIKLGDLGLKLRAVRA